MFEKHFGLRENPFHSGHQLRFLYPSREHQEARAHLRYGIENREPFVLITGEVGTGKTTALYDALAEWGTKVAVALITNSALTRQELIEEICLRFGLNVPPGSSKPQALSLLERHLTSVRARSEYAVLLLDEAQNLAPELLEEIRLLSNLEVQGDRLLQIFLVGQPELEAQLAAPQLRQLRQRISVHYRLNPLSPEETGAYIHHRISVAGGNPWATFPPESCRETYRITHGIPREINTVASAALIAAFSEGSTTVQPEHVRAIARESDFRSVLSGPSYAQEMPDPIPAPRATPPAEPNVPAPSAPAEIPATAAAPATAAWSAPEVPMSEPTPPVTPDTSSAHETVAPAPPAEPEPAAAEPVTPAAEPPAEIKARITPSWTPPELGGALPAPPASADAPPAAAEDAPHDPEVAFREATRVVDAWTAAAQELMEARRRNAPVENSARVEVIGAQATTPPAHEPAPPAAREFTPPAPEAPEHFPTPAELFARAEQAQPDSADLSGLPERLREKIAAEIAAEEQNEAIKRRAVPVLLAAVAVAALGIGAVMLQKMQVIDLPALRGIAGKHTASASAPAGAPAAAGAPASAGATDPVVTTLPSAPPPAHTDSTRHRALAALRDTIGTTATIMPAPAPPSRTPPAQATEPPVAAKPAPIAPAKVTAGATTTSHAAVTTPAHAAASTSAHTPAPAAKSAAASPAPTETPVVAAPKVAKPAAAKPVAARTDSSVFGVGVATYLDKDRAEQERARLATASGLPATVVPFNDEGSTKFRVVLGHYPSNAAAESAALEIMDKYRVSEARPLLLSRSKRH